MQKKTIANIYCYKEFNSRLIQSQGDYCVKFSNLFNNLEVNNVFLPAS